MKAVYNESDDTWTISNERFDELLKAEQFLSALQGAGVDNWDGYEVAQDMVEEWNSQS